MVIEMKMPQYGMGMSEGTVVEWLKGEGDAVEKDEVIGTVEAAKASSDLVAPAKGIMAQFMVQLDETVPVGTVIALIEES